MTQARATFRRTSLEKNKDEVIALLLTGWKQQEIATKYKVNPSSVHRFIGRHADRLQALRSEVAKRVEDHAITTKVNRIAAKDLRWQLLEQVRLARAEGQQGTETGLVVKTYKAFGSGENLTIVEEFKIDGELLAAMDRLERSAAEELAQLPKAGDVNVLAGDRARVLIVTSEEDLGFG